MAGDRTAQPAPLLERDAELAALRAAAAAARAGRGSIVVIEGEAGIGKSSLIRAFLAGLDDPVEVLVGGCDDLLAPRALGPLHEAVRGRPPGPLAASLDGPIEEVYDAAVEQLSGEPPTVLVVEDVHWADDATLDLLRHLARRVDGLPALLVLSLRDEELLTGHPARAMLGVLAAAPAVTHLRPAPLSPVAVDALAAPLGRDGAALHAGIGGNPFYVTETLAAPAGALPESVADAVAARLRVLDPACVAALEQLAVVPTHVEPLLAKALLGDGLAALAAAEERGVVEVRPAGLAFRHELARRAVAARLTGLRRRMLHLAVVRALRELGADDAERLVHHAVGAGDPATIVEFAPEAARAAALRGSHAQALAHLEAAVPHARLLDPAARAELLTDHAWQLYIGQSFAAAVDAGRAGVAACVEAGLVDLEIQGTERLSRYLMMCGELDEAERAQQRAMAAAAGGRGSPETRASLAVHRGAMLLLTGRFAEARAVLAEAIELTATVDRPDLRSLALNYRGLARAERGELAAGERDLRDALELALARQSHESAARAYANLSDMLFLRANWPALAEVVQRGREFCTERGMTQFNVLLDMHTLQLRMHEGAWDEAEAGLAALHVRAEGTAVFGPKVAAWYGRLLARRGREEQAELVARLVGDAWREACRQRQLVTMVYAGLAVVEWAWLVGHPEPAREVVQTLLPAISTVGWAPRRGELLRFAALAGVAEVTNAEPLDDYQRALALGWAEDPATMTRGWRALDALGAHAPARLVLRRLRDAGVTRLPRSAAAATRRPNPFGLTGRQADVLELLADGATNAEIAERLLLSVRTVDHHVSAILTRLGVRSRHEAAAAVRRAGGG
ncbi:MAG TPA: AAA family ATPase [Pseudonocardia sp.]|nr:AAA family ATPase [Pseudonocardia sp.]